MNTNSIEVFIFFTATGKQPFIEWQKKLDTKVQFIVASRIARLRNNNFGDCKRIQNSEIWELRINYGAGYRIYFGKTEHK